MKKIMMQWARLLLANFSSTVSQVGQDYWIINQVFNRKRNAYFVEIGAHDGLELSNTFLLEKRYSWTGLCIEANPRTFAILNQNRQVKCLNICLDNDEKEVVFHLDGMMSGIIDDGLDNSAIDKLNTSNVISLKTKKFEDVLIEHNAPQVIDYLSIDVEGAEERILSGFDFSKYTFLAITIERPSALTQKVFLDNGYTLVKCIPGLDYFYIHESHSKAYMQNVLNSYRKRRLLMWR